MKIRDISLPVAVEKDAEKDVDKALPEPLSCGNFRNLRRK
jgi:hypothetical protein